MSSGGQESHSVSEAVRPFGALRCLSAAEGVRLCEEFSQWLRTQPSLSTTFTSVCWPEERPPRYRSQKLSDAAVSPTFTAALTPEQLSPSTREMSTAKGTPPTGSDNRPSEPFTVLGLLAVQDDFLIEDIS